MEVDMSNLTRWEPFRDLLSIRRDMDRLFDEFYSQPLAKAEGMPLIDMYQTEDDIVVKATLPGVKADDLDIQITGDVLTIHGEVKEESEKKDAKYHMREQRYQSFSRSLKLPANVVADKAKAEMKDGILNLTLPKAEESKPKAISVKAK
jgi:HSP20 family protein